jgi:hypothetical protein
VDGRAPGRAGRHDLRNGPARAKRAELDRGGPDAIASPEVVNRIGQAALVQAHARFLVEGLAARP